MHKTKVILATEIILLSLIAIFLYSHLFIHEIDVKTSDLMKTVIEPIDSIVSIAPDERHISVNIEINEDFRESFVHGDKDWMYQKYIVLHDTEDNSNAESIINWWDSNGKGVATHFIINKDGSIFQCVPLNKIAHHVGYGDTGNNRKYGVEDESRDDKIGTGDPGEGVTDYGMNSYSVGIELVHVGGEGDYPERQLESLDKLIEYIDAYYGFKSEIIDHKEWRAGNSDTSPEFKQYLTNYRKSRRHR